MHSVALSGWLSWLAAIALCHFATDKVVRLLCWSEPARHASLPRFTGIALAPFLLGFSACIALYFFPHGSHEQHLYVLWGLPALIGVIACFLPTQQSIHSQATPLAGDERCAIWLMAAYAAALICCALLGPLTQNDAMEYVTVARIAFDSGSLEYYPARAPTAYASGFYATWTHPPLYVALIYAHDLFQGAADLPIMMRLISPWTALAGAGLIYAAGTMLNRRAGLFAALLFLSTPLLFMSASNALLDPLSILGSALVFISIFGFSSTPVKTGMVQGVFLGIALWVHSQAIIFPILLLVGLATYYGPLRWRGIFPQLFGILMTSLTIGIWPYISNYQSMGTVISDTPLVFTLKKLLWENYFAVARGVDSLAAQIQYGLFKGWFAYESYGGVFWLAIPAVIILLKLSPIKNRWIKNSAAMESPCYSILWAAAAIALAYHAGVALSIALGISQLVRVERYMLIILPTICLLAGWFVSYCQPREGRGRFIGRAILLLASLQLLIYTCYTLHSSGVSFTTLGQTYAESLMANPAQRTMAYVRKKTEKSSVILTLNAADMFYSDRRMVSYLDPRLLDFYAAETPQEGLAALKQIGITHVYVIPDALPPFYNSTLHSILADANLATLLYSDTGYQLYALYSSGKISKSIRNIAPGATAWGASYSLIIGGRKVLKTYPLKFIELQPGASSSTHTIGGLFQRDVMTKVQPISSIPVNSDGEYELTFELEGHGLLRLGLTEQDMEEKAIFGRTMLSELPLGRNAPTKTISYRFRTSDKTHLIMPDIEHYGNSTLLIKRATLTLLSTEKKH